MNNQVLSVSLASKKVCPLLIIYVHIDKHLVHWVIVIPK